MPCKECDMKTPTLQRKRMGSVGMAWCLLLSMTCLCFIPLTTDSCKDTDFICSKCQYKKKRVPAKCC